MVAPVGFTPDALKTAAQFGIDACVLRRGTDEDWEGFNRSLQATINMMSNLYYDAEVELADGRIIKVNEGGIHLLSDASGKTVFFDYIVNGALADRPDLQEKHVTIEPLEPLWEQDDEGGRVAVVALRCRRALVPGFTQTFIHTAPEDYVFAKLTPDGAIDERHFFEFADLDRIAAEFKRSP